MKRIVAGCLAVVVVATVLVMLQEKPPEGSPPAGLSAVDLLGGGADTGFSRADRIYRPQLPQDHGVHSDYRSEWWYFTGNLAGDAGRHFGFQLTFFRFALSPEGLLRDSAWDGRQTWMAHLAITDPAGDRFFSSERLSRGALGLAGTTAAPFRAWLDDWSAASEGADFFPLRLVADSTGFGIDLVVSPGKPAVLQGDQGYSVKGPGEGNASHYYSYTRMPARGHLTIGASQHEVTGKVWLDREWSTSALGPGVVGWDWFSLQMTDGWDLMFYLLRREDGAMDPLSGGSLVDPSGVAVHLSSADIVLEPRAYWTSPATGGRYPVSWSLQVPGQHLSLVIEPWRDDQEMDLSVRYWEGAVRARGTRAGRALEADGYLELTGYAR